MLNVPSYVETSIVTCCWETIIQFPISLKLAYQPPQRRPCQILNWLGRLVSTEHGLRSGSNLIYPPVINSCWLENPRT